MNFVEIDDPDDDRLYGYRHLKDAQLRSSIEQGSGLFVAEGELAVSALASSRYGVHSVLVLKRRVALIDELGLPGDATVFVADQEVMSGVAGYVVHRGLLALGHRGEPQLAERLLDQANDLVVVAEGINDTENLGAIFRNAAAFGAEAVLLDPTCADPLYRRSVRVSLGHVLRVPFARLPPWPASKDLIEAAGFKIACLTPRSGESVDEVASSWSADAVAVVLGAERDGLSSAALGSGRRTRIPTAPGVDSLNVAAATAVVLHAFRRLRPFPSLESLEAGEAGASR